MKKSGKVFLNSYVMLTLLLRTLESMNGFRIMLRIQFSSWMGGDRDGSPRVTPEVTRDVCILSRMMAANMYFSQIEDLMFEMYMWHCSDELRVRAEELHISSSKRDVKHYIEFWKQVPPTEPYRVILGW